MTRHRSMHRLHPDGSNRLQYYSWYSNCYVLEGGRAYKELLELDGLIDTVRSEGGIKMQLHDHVYYICSYGSIAEYCKGSGKLKLLQSLTRNGYENEIIRKGLDVFNFYRHNRCWIPDELFTLISSFLLLPQAW